MEKDTEEYPPIGNMTDYNSDEVLGQIHDEMYRAESERPKSQISSMSQQSKFFMGLFVGAVILLIAFDKIELKEGLIALAAGVALLYFMLGTKQSRTELTWIECMMRIYEQLHLLQKHPIGDMPQIPKGAIHVKPIGRKQWYEGQSFKRSYAVDLYEEELGISEMYFIEVDIFTGDIITFKHSPEGVTGDETKDIKLMPTYDLRIQRKKDAYLGKQFGKKTS